MNCNFLLLYPILLLHSVVSGDNLTTEAPEETAETIIEEESGSVIWILTKFYNLLDQIHAEVSAGNYSHIPYLVWSKICKLIDFTDFQVELLREFSLILLGNLLLVLLAWRIYGPKISAKFGLQPGGSRRVIEELRLSMSEFQLPKEHDFKFK